MVFITQPNKEAETKKCDSCGMDLVGRLTDYKGRFPDKLQWQSATERKAHYDKDGNCKNQEETPDNEIELKPKDKSQTTLPEKITHNLTTQEMLERIYAMTEEMYQDFTDRKLKESKTQ